MRIETSYGVITITDRPDGTVCLDSTLERGDHEFDFFIAGVESLLLALHKHLPSTDEQKLADAVTEAMDAALNNL